LHSPHQPPFDHSSVREDEKVANFNLIFLSKTHHKKDREHFDENISTFHFEELLHDQASDS